VKKEEINTPIEIQKQAVDPDEEVPGVAAPAVGPWQRQLNELGGVKPLAFGQYGELGPGFEQLLDQLAEEGADEAAKRYLIPNRVVAKGVQLRLLRQRVVMTAQKAQADMLLHRLHYALPGWDAAAERRDAQDELHSAAQSRAWADGDFDADHGLAFDVRRPTAWAARLIRAGCAASEGRRRRRLCARARPCCLMCMGLLHQKKKERGGGHSRVLLPAPCFYFRPCVISYYPRRHITDRASLDFRRHSRA
jgi:hypothetical protein